MIKVTTKSPAVEGVKIALIDKRTYKSKIAAEEKGTSFVRFVKTFLDEKRLNFESHRRSKTQEVTAVNAFIFLQHSL